MWISPPRTQHKILRSPRKNTSAQRHQAAGPNFRDVRLLLLLRLEQLVAFPEDSEDRVRGAGIEAQAATFQAACGVELIRGGGEPGPGRTHGHADRVMGAAVGVADQVVANDHHGFDSFKETLREDLEHVLFGDAAHGHSLTRAFNRAFNSGICSRLFSIAPMIFSRRACFSASLSCFASRSYSTYASRCLGSSSVRPAVKVSPSS